MNGNEPDGIENATHNTCPKKFDIEIKICVQLFLEMYCGLHFQFRQAHYHL
jgi:hypothetical protein